MEKMSVVLTEKDRLILESYKNLIDGLADYLGTGFEIVLHSLEDLEKSVIKIVNGFHTGRKEGAPVTDLALNMISKISSENLGNSISYFAKNRKGEPMKSSTMVIRGEENKIIGVLCINFYLNTPISTLMDVFTPVNQQNNSIIKENFAETAQELIMKSLEEAREQVENDDKILPSLKNREIIFLLYNWGIFKMKDAVEVIAQAMNLSKNTVYLHLRSIKNNKPAES
jgi:predicted transcriptional regulator YheO